MSDLSESWNEHRKHKKEETAKRLANRTEDINAFAELWEFKIEWISEYQVRMWLKDKILDYYPSNKKATVLRSQKWFVINDIENYIKNIYE